MTSYSLFCYYYPQCIRKYIKDCICTQHSGKIFYIYLNVRMYLLNLIWIIWQIYIFIQPNHQSPPLRCLTIFFKTVLQDFQYVLALLRINVRCSNEKEWRENVTYHFQKIYAILVTIYFENFVSHYKMLFYLMEKT